MKYYLAPLEGITNVFLRNAYDRHFDNIDKYYIPFLEPKNFSLSTKDLRETSPNNNKLKAKVVPQIISKNIEGTIWMINELNKLGYDEINLNFGCPSPTVTTKGKGSGMLKNPEYMDNYLKEIFNNTNCKISIKLRLGLDDVNEFKNVLDVLNKYDIYELIVHPRTGKEKYSSKLHLDTIENLDKLTRFDIIYNGEIKSIEDIKYIETRLPFIKGVMIGRGLISYPDMLDADLTEIERKKVIRDYFYDFSKENISMFGYNTSKFFQRGIWALLVKSFDCPMNLFKKLCKAENEDDYYKMAEEIFNTCPLNKNRPSIKDYL